MYVTFTRSFSFIVIVLQRLEGEPCDLHPREEVIHSNLLALPCLNIQLLMCQSVRPSGTPLEAAAQSGALAGKPLTCFLSPRLSRCATRVSVFPTASTRTLDKWFLTYWEETLLQSPVSFSLAEDLENVRLYLMLKKVHQFWGFVHLKAFNSED